MRSVIELDVNVRQEKLAELFTDPRRNPEWMDDLERIEPVSGDLGAPGSSYRLVPKKGRLTFVARVISRELPTAAELVLEAPNVSVSVTGRFIPLSETTSRLVSEEIFKFNGVLWKFLELFARRAIKGSHRKQMESFKRSAERQG
ncbi:MAG: SRPBCC family protein [Steroidobacteraceae bacterium]